ncbi:MAG: hypothetical protein K2I06_01695 [Ruminococcus sp.]|nr:hypothetical protein [Ruminococcus sp.]
MINGILALGEEFTKRVISSAEGYFKNNKLSQEQRDYYGELSKNLTAGLSKIDEYRNCSKKINPLTNGTVKREPYNVVALRAMALLEPYFGFYRKKYAYNWFFFDKAPIHDKDTYLAIEKRCASLNLRPYITIHPTNSQYNHIITLCDYGVLQIVDFSNSDYWFENYGDIRQVTIVNRSATDSTNVNFGASESFFKTCPGISMTCSTKADERKEIANMAYDFISTINDKCRKVEKNKFF